MITAKQLKDAIDLLESFRTDYQLDKNSKEYKKLDPLSRGFLSVSQDFLKEEDIPVWNTILDNPHIFCSIISGIGLETLDGLDVDETVFTLAD